jgi:N-acetylmuramoyl-L-alanine amidase
MSAATALPAAAATSPLPSQPAPFVVALDPGHGGVPNDAHPDQLFDPGAVSNTGSLEKDLTLKIALQLRDLLRVDGVKVVMTRQDDRFVEISQRMSTANQAHANLFLSIHLNSFTDSTAHGSVVLFPVEADRLLAETLSAALHRRLQNYGFADGGVLPKFDLWTHAAMPAATVEAGYLSNEADAQALDRAVVRDTIARALRDGIELYAPQIARIQTQTAAFRAARVAHTATWALPGLPSPRLVLAGTAAIVMLAAALRQRRRLAFVAGIAGGFYASFLSPNRRPARRRRAGGVRPRRRTAAMPTISARVPRAPH